jgi:shikimate dehydrogenase
MAVPYAEVIGDPVAQTKSPLIHRHWLATLGLEGSYQATRVLPEELQAFLSARRDDPAWRGCNVTIPHKERAMPLLDHVQEGAREIGAVNCIAPGPQGLTGRNTDIDGVAAALDDTPLTGRKVVLIGGGGGARAALCYLGKRRASSIEIVVRDPQKAAHFRREGPGTVVNIHAMDRCQAAFQGAAAIVQASPLGMTGSPPMPTSLLDCVAANANGATLLDMVYNPLETPFLAVGRAHGGIAVDGLVMLIGQARAAFELFFGCPAPSPDGVLRNLLAS